MTNEAEKTESEMNGLSESIQITGYGARALSEEFEKLNAAGKQFATNFERDISKAMRSVVIEGQSMSQVLKNIALSMADRAFESAMSPVMEFVSQSVAVALPFGREGGAEQGSVMPFAKGGVVNGPMHFGLSGGTGLMGEAGPEAIMPLSRGDDGALGVQMRGGKKVEVHMNIETPNAESFRQSKSQIASELYRAIHSANR